MPPESALRRASRRHYLLRRAALGRCGTCRQSKTRRTTRLLRIVIIVAPCFADRQTAGAVSKAWREPHQICSVARVVWDGLPRRSSFVVVHSP